MHAEFGFTLDVCASAENAKCDRFFTREDNGLTQDWTGHVCWMNPPYGRTIGKWMQKAHDANATVVCLVPARVDTAWWHSFAAHGEVRFLKGRLKFGGHANSAPFPSAVVVFRNKPEVTKSFDASRTSSASRLTKTPLTNRFPPGLVDRERRRHPRAARRVAHSVAAELAPIGATLSSESVARELTKLRDQPEEL